MRFKDYFGYIYKTTNLLNNKIYIGKRKGKENLKYLGSGIYLNNAIKKYGKEYFSVEIVEFIFEEHQINEKEKYYISKFRTELGKENLYNIADGGDGGVLVRMFGKNNPQWHKKGKNSPFWIEREKRKCVFCETEFEVRITSIKKFCNKKCLNKGMKGIYNPILDKYIKVSNKEIQKYLNEGWELGRGTNFRKKCSDGKKGNKNPMYGKGYLVSGEKNSRYGKPGTMRGKHHTESSINKIRIKKLGKTPWNKGKKVGSIYITDETRRKMSLANKGKKAWNKGLTKETDERVKNQYKNKLIDQFGDK